MTAYNPLQIGFGSQAKAKGIAPDRPMEAFKFVQESDVHFWTAEETVKLDTLRSYSSQESRGGRGDPLEIEFRDMHGYLHDSRAPEAQTLVRNLDDLGIAKVGAAMHFSVQGQHYTRKNRFVYCLSDSLTEDLYRQWSRVEGYDAVIRIPSLQWLVSAIQSTDSTGACLLGGTGIIDWVEYAEMPVDLSIVDMTVFKFIKDRSQFAWQRELRVSWPKVLVAEQTPYIVHVPGLSQHVEVVPIPAEWRSRA